MLSMRAHGWQSTQAKACATSDPGRNAEFIEQRFSLFEVTQFEAFGEPTVDLCKHRARLIAAIGVAEQAREAHRRAQLPPFGLLRPGNFERGAKAILGFGRR